MLEIISRNQDEFPYILIKDEEKEIYKISCENNGGVRINIDVTPSMFNKFDEFSKDDAKQKKQQERIVNRIKSTTNMFSIYNRIYIVKISNYFTIYIRNSICCMCFYVYRLYNAEGRNL